MARSPAGGRVTAITFDFWNTLYSADGPALEEVRPRRIEALRGLLASCGLHPAPEELENTYRAGFDAYMVAWTSGRHFGAQEQVKFVLAHFGVDPERVPEALVAETVLEIENASLSVPLQLLPGARETIPTLAAAGFRLGIISDTSLTPGRLLRESLAADGLLDHFSALSFSDEVGYPKPDPRIFARTLATLDALPCEAVHIGDTPRTDIAGAHALGMLAIRCTAAVDQTEPPEADFVISDHREIPAILSGLRRSGKPQRS